MDSSQGKKSKQKKAREELVGGKKKIKVKENVYIYILVVL